MQTKMTVSLKYQKDIGGDVIEIKAADSMNSIILLTGFIDNVKKNLEKLVKTNNFTDSLIIKMEQVEDNSFDVYCEDTFETVWDLINFTTTTRIKQYCFRLFFDKTCPTLLDFKFTVNPITMADLKYEFAN